MTDGLPDARPDAGLSLTQRDRQIVHAVWSLGAAPSLTLQALISPTTSIRTFRTRLRRLTTHGYLRQQQHIAVAGRYALYGLGRAALQPGDPLPWTPSLAQLDHTLAIGSTLTALHRPDLMPGLSISGWKGESELRAWAAPGAPYPDAAVTWTYQPTAARAESRGGWNVEVDRSTESHAAWRKKLLRYLTTPHGYPVLAVTRSAERASGLARIAADLGVPCLALPLQTLENEVDPVVLDARHRRKVPLSHCITAAK